MNSLSLLIQGLSLDSNRVMDALQLDAGIISDLCVNAEDVASKDCFRACQWVEKNQEVIKTYGDTKPYSMV